MALFQKFVFDDVASIPVEALLQKERDEGVDNETSIAEQLEAEREAARVVARAEGFEAGLAFARSEREANIQELVSRLSQQVEAAVADIEVQVSAVANEASLLAFDLAQALAGEALRIAPRAPMIAAIKAILSDAVQRPKLIIKLSRADLPEVEDTIATVTAAIGFDGRIVLAADEALPAGDCKIDWQTGGIHLSQEARARAVRQLVDSFSSVA